MSDSIEGLFFLLHKSLVLSVCKIELRLLLARLKEETEGRHERDEESQNDDRVCSDDNHVRRREHGPFCHVCLVLCVCVDVVCLVFCVLMFDLFLFFLVLIIFQSVVVPREAKPRHKEDGDSGFLEGSEPTAVKENARGVAGGVWFRADDARPGRLHPSSPHPQGRRCRGLSSPFSFSLMWLCACVRVRVTDADPGLHRIGENARLHGAHRRDPDACHEGEEGGANGTRRKEGGAGKSGLARHRPDQRVGTSSQCRDGAVLSQARHPSLSLYKGRRRSRWRSSTDHTGPHGPRIERWSTRASSNDRCGNTRTRSLFDLWHSTQIGPDPHVQKVGSPRS